jgi:anti-sigma B factor antagonist
MENELQVLEQDGVILVTVQESACDQIWRVIQPQFEAGKRRCVLDFSGVTYLNSMSIASIIALNKKVSTAGGKLALANLKDNIKSVFRILKLEKLFGLEFDNTAAKAAVSE